MLTAARSPDLESAIARAQWLQDVLRDLTEMGMELVRALRREMAEGAAAVDIADRFCRLAKAIRQLVALEARLAQALDDVATGRWAAEEAERELAALTAQAREEAAVEVLVEAVREGGDDEAIERLRERLDDWSCQRETERDFTEMSVAQLIARACKAMDVDPDPALIAQETLSQTLADAVRAYAKAREAGEQAIADPPASHLDSNQLPAQPRAPALAEGP